MVLVQRGCSLCIVHDYIGRADGVISVTHEFIIIQRSSVHHLREDLGQLRASTKGERQDTYRVITSWRSG
jgi:hypothetical protein